MPGTTSSSSKPAPQPPTYHRPGYLRALEAYEGAKAVYNYTRGFVVVRSVAPLVERVAEGTLSRLPVIKTLKQAGEEAGADAAKPAAAAAAAAASGSFSYPTLHGIDAKLAALLASLDSYVDTNLGNPKTYQGMALRAATHTIYYVANWTPVVGGRIKKLMIEIDPEHMSLAPRLMNRPALEVDGEDAELRGSFDKDMDDVSVVTDASEEVAAANGKKGKKKKEKRKDKRFLQNMGKGIKKVMNYPRTPVHDIIPPNGTGNGSENIGTEEEASVTSGAGAPPTPGGSGSGASSSGAAQPASSNASIASTDAVASTTSSSTASTPLRATARKFFAAAAPGSGGKSKSKAAAAAASPAAAATSGSGNLSSA